MMCQLGYNSCTDLKKEILEQNDTEHNIGIGYRNFVSFIEGSDQHKKLFCQGPLV